MPTPNVSEWRKKKADGEWRELPSGLRLRVRRLSLLQVATTGSIPTNLIGQVDILLKETVSPREAVNKYMGAIEAHIMLSVVEPRVVPADQDPGDDAISVKELDVDDKLAIFNWLNSAPGTLLGFLETETR
jgi:hypothetical protein